MKIIQSFWGGRNKSIKNNYGWADYKSHWLSWMFSCYQLRKFYNQVELYTDEFGYDVLIRQLNLPYTKVHVILDDLNELPGELWAMAKIKVYSLQNEPFLHVDGDVFIFEPFSEELLKAELIAQNPEKTTKYYSEMWNNIHNNLLYMPEEILDYHRGKHQSAYNMGIFGGNDINFFKRYTQIASDFVYTNKNVWDKINLFNFNVFFEQVLFCECAYKENKQVEVLIHDEIGDNDYIGFGDFDNVPETRTYLHLLGVFKTDSITCSKMFQYCWYNHPEWINKLLDITSPNHQEYTKFRYSKTENEDLVKWYSQHIDTETEITNKRLLARDLFTYEQVRKIDQYHQHNIDYEIILLPEIVINQDTEKFKLYTKELGDDNFVREMDQMDEVIFYELNSPKRKSELYNAIICRFEEEPSDEEKAEFQTILYKLLRHYIGLKVLAVKHDEYTH